MKSYYEIGKLLGKGNFAKVYEATNFQTKQKFALKTIEKKILSKNQKNFVSFDVLTFYSSLYSKKFLFYEDLTILISFICMKSTNQKITFT